MRLTVFVLCIQLLLTGCGIKPGDVSPPDGDKDQFPQTYPNPSTDPHPERFIR